MLGPFSRWLWAGWLLLALPLGCKGTEYTLFGDVLDRGNPNPNPAQEDAGQIMATPEAGAGGSQGMAGSGVDPGPPPEPLNPNVSFQWTETLLPGRGTCREGLYLGKFSCSAQGDAGIEALVVFTGQVVLPLRRAKEEPVLLHIVDGLLIDDVFPVFSANPPLNGSLNCAEDQQLTATAHGSSLLLAEFSVSMDGQLDSETLVIAGTFEIVTAKGDDRWSCTYQANAAP
jgi:hypothetical protein